MEDSDVQAPRQGAPEPLPPTPRQRLIPYLVNAAVGLVLVGTVSVLRDLFKQQTATDILRVLADAFFVPGVVLICVWLLRRMRRQGMFFGLGYIGTYCLHSLLPFATGGKSGKARPYREWCEEREEKFERQGGIPRAQLVVGLALLLTGVVLTVVFTVLSGGV